MGSRYWCAIEVLLLAATLTVSAPKEPVVTPSAEDISGRAMLTDTTVPRDLCRLPVVTLAGNGFVTYPGAVYTPDPSGQPALPAPNESGPPNYGYAYDAVYSRWLPVAPSLVSPDGTHYVFMDSNANLSTVDVRTGQDTQLTADGTGAWHPVGWQAAGVYAIQATSPGPHPGLWLVPYPSGTPKRVTNLGYWQAAGPGAAYGTMESIPPPDTSVAIVRLDLASGAITRWFYQAGQRALGLQASTALALLSFNRALRCTSSQPPSSLE